jgi:hypothetical protein
MPNHVCCRSGSWSDLFRAGLAMLVPAMMLLPGTSLVQAQPATFFDVGDITAPATPPSTTEYVNLPFNLFDFGGGEILTVKWLRFNLTDTVTSPLFFDVDTRIYEGGDLFLALYDNAGNLVATDDVDGSFPDGIGAGLSFGSLDARNPPTTPRLAGQDGATLPSGVYWLALVAGGASSVTANPTAWDVTTTDSIQLGFFLPGTSYLEMAILVGNTVPFPPPANDNCENALPLGEDAAPGEPAWVGTNQGATNDGFTPCYGTPAFPALAAKDIWFLYTPTQTGKAVISASGGAGGAATPVLSAYFDGCGSSVRACSGGGSIGFVGDRVRLVLDVVAGQPVLLSLSVRAGQFGDMDLSIRLVPPPCSLSVPAGTAQEIEQFCGEDLNGGCNVTPAAYDTITPGQPVTGTLFNTRSLRDTDWFQFTIEERSNVSVSLSAQFASVVAIQRLVLDEACFANELLFAESPDYFNPCVPAQANQSLEGGTYLVVVAHRFFDGFSCGSGYEQYVLSLNAEPCFTPSFAQPADVVACAGTTTQLSVDAGGAGALSYGWDVGIPFGGDEFFWFEISDGSLPTFTGSQAVVSGSNTSTLTISGLDQDANQIFRVRVTACDTFPSEPIFLTVLPADAPECAANPCDYDYNQDENVDLLDAQQMAQVFVGLLSAEANWLDGDLNGDENADLTDAQLLASFVVSGQCGL